MSLGYAIRHTLSILILPVSALIVVPAIVLLLSGVNVGCGLAMPLGIVPALVGSVLVLVGLLLMMWTISLFAAVGQGTLAPWDPTQRLVVRGIYRRVRNPMISGVLFVLLGESVLFGSWLLLVWFALFFTANAIYIPLVEEPGLLRRFGDDYRRYKENVPRWLPRLSPWKPTTDEPDRSIES